MKPKNSLIFVDGPEEVGRKAKRPKKKAQPAEKAPVKSAIENTF
jgi:hypothetical protein